MKKYLLTVIVNITLSISTLFNTNMSNSKIIAHGCGDFNGISYTNSLNALDSNYEKGFRYFEIDLNYTSDGHIVLIHDWENTENELLGISKKILGYNEFKNLKPRYNLTLMDIDMLISWLVAHNDAYVITDCKYDNLKMLREISFKYPNMLQRFVPQMGTFGEYKKLHDMGYQNIILGVNRTNYSDDAIINFVRIHKFYAVTMPVKRAETDLLSKLKETDIKVFVYTVNDTVTFEKLINKGVYGIYSDSINLK